MKMFKNILNILLSAVALIVLPMTAQAIGVDANGGPQYSYTLPVPPGVVRLCFTKLPGDC